MNRFNDFVINVATVCMVIFLMVFTGMCCMLMWKMVTW